jgi:cytochrome c oxidase subunit III
MRMFERPRMAELLKEQFADMEQQRETSSIGMWIFLATEVMFFGGMFTAFACYHHLYPEAFKSASRHTDFWMGSINTAVLLISSLFMALAVQASKTGDRRALVRFLVTTIGLGLVFLGLKGAEYAHHIHDHLLPGPSFRYENGSEAGAAQLFFFLYFAMTGLHAIHMIGGIVLLVVLTVMARRGKFSPYYHTQVELGGLYWHFVDVIWIFLFPMFYLIGGR